jgi:hypothetical protein
MSINSQTHIERRLLNRELSGNNPERKSPFANDYLSRVEYLNPSSVTQAGLYEKIISLPRPIKPWHRASKGVTERFRGCLTEMFPELRGLSEKDLKEMEKERHGL